MIPAYASPLSAAAAAARSLPATVETGTVGDGFPYATVGGGPRRLVVLPGIGDALFPGIYPPGAGWALAPYFARYLETHAVTLLSRPRGLPAGYDAAEAAARHVRALEGLGTGDEPVDVVGVSMGGLIGQELTRRYPGRVDHLVLANSACRLAESARDDVRRLERHARERDWFSIRADLARAMYSDVRQSAYPPWIQTVGRAVLPRPAEPADVWRSLELILGFDGCDRLEAIRTPTLVFGGEADPYFTAPVVRETAEGLADASLELVDGAKHGAFHERKWTFDSRVLECLDFAGD